MQRRHNRDPCIFDEADDHDYLGWLSEVLERERCALRAYVLMTNHVQQLVTPKRAERIPRLIVSVGRRYVQHINRSDGRN